MGYLGLIVCIFGLIISIILGRKTKILSPAVLYYALWLMILFLSLLNLYGLAKPSGESLGLIAVMNACFLLGTILSCLKKDVKANRKPEKIAVCWKIIYALYAIAIIFGIIDVLLVYKYAASGIPLWKVRNWTLEPFGSSNPILDRRSFVEELIRTIVITPYNQIFTPLVSYYLLNGDNKKKNKKKILLVLLIVKTLIDSVSGGGGRLGFICLALYFLTSYLTFKNRAKMQDKKTKSMCSVMMKYKKYIYLVAIFGIFAMITTTNLRTGAGNLFKQFYTYFAMPPTLLSIWLPSIENSAKTYGLSSLFGVHTYIFRGLERIGFSMPAIYEQAFRNILNAEVFRDAGFGIANAFVTPVYYFVCDGGTLFVIIASFIFGFLVMSPYKKLINNSGNIRNYLIYATVMVGVLSTFMRIQTIAPAYVISFAMIFVITKKEIENGKK